MLESQGSGRQAMMGAPGVVAVGEGMGTDVSYLGWPLITMVVEQVALTQGAATETAGTTVIGPGTWRETRIAARTESRMASGATVQIMARSDHTVKPARRFDVPIGCEPEGVGDGRWREYDCCGKKEELASVATGVSGYDEGGIRSGARTRPWSE
jgi:hypothetical protein